MQLAVISDLHLGAGDDLDAFGHDDADFLRFLDFLERNFETVVLLGDIWETLTEPRFGRTEHALERARGFHGDIARRFASSKYRYVFGNHDLVAGRTDEAPESLIVEADGVRILLTHGHQEDALIQRARWISEVGVWLGGWIRRLGQRSLYETCSRLDELRTGLPAGANASAFARWAYALAGWHDVDVVVTGHTHHARRDEVGDRLLLNSGSCSEGRFSFLSLDTARGRYSVHESW